MDQNLQSMMERGEKLEDLEHKTGKRGESKYDGGVLTDLIRFYLILPDLISL